MQHHRMTGFLFTLASVCCFAATPAVAETYKWTDAEGKVHYSDQPPPANVKQSTMVKQHKQPAAAAAPEAAAKPVAAAKSYVEQDAEFKQRRVEAAEREAAEKKAAQEAAEKKKNCEQAKTQMARLQAGGRLARYNEKGEIEYLTDAQIAQEAARAKQAADTQCK